MITACNSFKLELLQGVHVFAASGGDTFKLALYEPTATLSANTTVYTVAGEVVGGGYTSGGLTLTTISPVLVNGVAFASFDPAVYFGVTISVRYALLYNATKANRAVAVFDFGQTYQTSGTTLEILMPPATSTNAIIRVT